MDNINNAQTNAKTFLKRVSMISAIALVLSITYSNSYAVPPEHRGNCEYDHVYLGGAFMCCWTESEESDPEQIEIYKCQTCWIEGGVVACDPPRPDPNAPPTTGGTIVPEDEEVLEQPPKTDDQPIKSGDSVFPNDDSNAIDEQQPNPNSPLTDQRVPPDNVGVLEQLDDSSNNQNSESGESVSSDNPGLLNVVPQNPQS